MSSGKSSSGGSNSKSGRAGPDAGSRGSGKGRGPRPGQGRAVRTGPGQEAPQVRAGTAMFPFKMRRRGEGGGTAAAAAGWGGAGGGLREASRPLFHLLLLRGASGAALAAAPLRAARYDLPAALAPSALSAWPGTCAQIAAAANLPAPPSPVAPSLPPSLSSAGPPPRAPVAATRPPVPARPSSPFTPEPALLACATDLSPGPRVLRPSLCPSAQCMSPPSPPNLDLGTSLCPVSENSPRRLHI